MSHKILGTFHSTCMVNDYDATVAALQRFTGMCPLEYSALEMFGRRGGCSWIGDGLLEVGEPIVEGHSVERFVRKFGPGMHSYALHVADLDSTIEHLAASGVTASFRPNSIIAFTDPRTTGGLLFQWSATALSQDPRVTKTVPPVPPAPPLLDARSQAFVGAVLPDPIAWAETFGELLGFRETFRDADAPLGEPMIGLAVPEDCMIALYRLPGDESESLWGQRHRDARMHVLGLGVPSLDEAAKVLADASVDIVRRTDNAIVVNPMAIGEVPLVLVEDLLPGDPRL
jgi:hypothetical protein